MSAAAVTVTSVRDRQPLLDHPHQQHHHHHHHHLSIPLIRSTSPSTPALPSPPTWSAPSLTSPLTPTSASNLPLSTPTSPSTSNSSVSQQPHPSHPSPRTIDRTMPPPSFLPRKRKLAPATTPSSPSSSPTPERSTNEDEDDEYAPLPLSGSSSSKRPSGHNIKSSGAGGAAGGARGGKTNANNRGMSREQLRKANHSMIERRRREKINAALGELRDMVPDLGGEAKGGEFKLEVLERTVAYMKELKERIMDLETRLDDQLAPRHGVSTLATTTTLHTKSSRSSPSSSSTSGPDILALPPPPPPPPVSVTSTSAYKGYFKQVKNSQTPPSPSSSPDPNETEPETNLPPPYALSSRTHTPTIASLLHSANSNSISSSNRSSEGLSRPQPSAQAANPTLYLPFPTPSPTSPFLTYNGGSGIGLSGGSGHGHGTSISSSSTSSTGPPEPSPFLAPMHGMSLFGGALNLDNSGPMGLGLGGKESVSSLKDMKAEEAANVLLAFSSPDTLKPIIGSGLGLTPKMVPVGGGVVGAVGAGSAGMGGGMRERRLTLDSEEFVLDGGVRSGVKKGERSGVVGKTARDILKM